MHPATQPRSATRRLTLLLPASALLLGILLASCKREERPVRVQQPSASAATQVTVTDLYAGGPPTTEPDTHVKLNYEENAYAMSEGKRLFDQYNCPGCHAHGGGDKGPALMDDKWIYGSAPEQIHATIIQGRPNGMPSFRNKIPDQQAWQLVAYVRSMSGLASSGAAPTRSDHMQTGQPEGSTPTTTPHSTGVPKSSEMPQ